MSILLNDNLKIAAAKPVDSRYGPYTDTDAAKLALKAYQRYVGLTVGIITNNVVVEYWFKAGIDNSDLVLKTIDGVAGATGAQGVAGIDGATGATGVTGATGPEGPVGLTGLTGAPGETGATGATGEIGATGIPGEPGVQGATGATGPAGDYGATGATGPIGPSGISDRYQTTSTSSNQISVGSKTFTTATTGLSYTPNQDVTITDANNVLNYMTGKVTSFSGDQLVIDVTNAYGPDKDGANKSSFIINLSGAVGAVGATGVGTVGATGATGPVGATGAAGDATLTEAVTANIAAGAISIGTVVDQGTTFLEFVRKLITTVYNPTYTAPSASLSSSISSPQEVGYSASLTLTANLNKGAILGNLVNGLWNASSKQADRSGAANNYTINGVDRNTTNTYTLPSAIVISAGNNTYSATIDYDQGPQPLNSLGQSYQTPLAAGSVSASTTIVGYRKTFYGTKTNKTDTINSAFIRGLASSSNNGLANGDNFTISIAAGTARVVFAYPATLRDVSSVQYVERSNEEVKGNFGNPTLLTVAGAGSDAGVSYKVYVYDPDVAFTTNVSFKVTI